MKARHWNHPSAQCECPTCDLEYSCPCPDGGCDCAEYEVAVNPTTGVIVTFSIDATDRPAVELITHCPSTGKVVAIAKTYDDWADAVATFHRQADWAPTAVEWP